VNSTWRNDVCLSEKACHYMLCWGMACGGEEGAVGLTAYVANAKHYIAVWQVRYMIRQGRVLQCGLWTKTLLRRFLALLVSVSLLVYRMAETGISAIEEEHGSKLSFCRL
jgi:hypothetical protein